MSAQHTPGPWKVRKEWRGDGREVYPDVKVDVGQPSEVCVVSGVYKACAANARLIASAPDLFALAQSLRGVRKPNDDGGHDYDMDALDAVFVAADAVVAKVTGAKR